MRKKEISYTVAQQKCCVHICDRRNAKAIQTS